MDSLAGPFQFFIGDIAFSTTKSVVFFLFALLASSSRSAGESKFRRGVDDIALFGDTGPLPALLSVHISYNSCALY